MKRFSLLLTLAILFWQTFTVQAEVPKLINYQGKLTTSEAGCVDTSVQMTFSIYSDSVSIDPLWTETQYYVRVKDGVFSVLLGSVDSIPCSVFTGGIRYLGVKVEDDREMTPRKAIVSVGYSFRSDLSDTAQYAVSAPPDDDWQTDTSGFNIYRFTGNVGVGTMPQDSCKLFVQSDSMVGDYAVYARGGTGLKAIATAWEGTGIQGEGGHAGVAGNGYIGILGQGFWAGWFEGKGYFSGNVGIGTMSPDQELEVDGNAHITGDLTIGPTTRYCTVPGATFLKMEGSAPVAVADECHLEIGYGWFKIGAPLQLPHGASISEVTLYLGDIIDGQCGEIELKVGRVSLFEKPNCPMEVIGSVLIPSPPAIDYDSLTISSFSQAIVDNSGFSYWITINGNCWHYGLYNARIKYVVSKPLP
jgi:hypothetical protein